MARGLRRWRGSDGLESIDVDCSCVIVVSDVIDL